MEELVNPYETGQAYQQGYTDTSANLPVTPVALNALIGTKFWVSLVGFVILLIVAINTFSLLFINSQFGNGGVLGVFIFPLIMVVIQVILAVRLIQYSKAIGRLKTGGKSIDFERAMEVQSKFWRLSGIVCLVMIVMIVMVWIGAAFMFRL